jgi:hypothetical protein
MSRAGRRWDVPGVGAELDELARKQAEVAGVSIAEYVRRAVATAVAGHVPESTSPSLPDPERVPDPEPASSASPDVPERLKVACLSTLRQSRAPATNDGRALLDHIASRAGTSADTVRRAALRAGLIVLHTRPDLVRQLEPSAPVAGEAR